MILMRGSFTNVKVVSGKSEEGTNIVETSVG